MQTQSLSENILVPVLEHSELLHQRVIDIPAPSTQFYTGRMRALFSGHGKAEKNMGMAAIPPLWTPGPPSWR